MADITVIRMTKLEEQESSSEGLASSEYDTPSKQDLVHDRDRKRSMLMYHIPRVPKRTVPTQKRSRSPSHDRRFSHHGEHPGHRGARGPVKGLKRQRTPSPDYEDYWYDYTYKSKNYDGDSYGYDCEQEYQEFEEEDDYEYDGYDDYEYEASDYDGDDRYSQYAQDQRFHYETESGKRHKVGGSDEWDKVQERMAAKYARKKSRPASDKPRASIAKDRTPASHGRPKVPEVREKPRKRPSNAAAGSQDQLDTQLTAQAQLDS